MNKSVDLLGVGFGPAGISFAAALEDKREDLGRYPVQSHRFIESGPDCQWQRELLFEDADINHSHLRDLVTPRNPRSFFSFANYLKSVGRLYSFGLTGRPVSRIEWSDYLNWAGNLLSLNTTFNCSVSSLAVSDWNEGQHRGITATLSTGGEPITACNLVLSTGASPTSPDYLDGFHGARCFHASQYHTKIERLKNDASILSVAVIGSGMSAGEIVMDLRQRFPNANIHSIHRSHGFKLNDLSNFSSEVYSPEETEYVYGLNPEGRQNVLRESWKTNYAGLDADGSSQMYNAMYLDQVLGRRSIYMEKRRHISSVEMTDGRYELCLLDKNAGDTKRIDVDIVIAATGYSVDPMKGLLAGLKDYLVLDDRGQPVISRNYRVETIPELGASVYLNGLCELSHGISDAQSFSLLADRSGWILDDMLITGVFNPEAKQVYRPARLEEPVQ